MSTPERMTKYIELDWEAPWPPLYGRPITIDKNTIIWRSYDTSFPAIGDRFAYYSSKAIAEEYKNTTRELGCFVTTRPLKLLDYRFMRVLLSRIISSNSHDKAIQYLASVMMSFGLCSLGHQINMVKMRYNGLNKTTNSYKHIENSIKALTKYYKPGNIIEQSGVRIAETTNDAYTMGFLQELFKDTFDGFISPRLYSPFHTEKANSLMSPEMILFNPKDSGIKELIYPKPQNILKIKIADILHNISDYIVLDNVKMNATDMNMRLEFYMCGGNQKEHYLDKAEELLNSNERELSKLYNDGCKIGTKWKKKIVLRVTEAPVPCIPVNPFALEIGI